VITTDRSPSRGALALAVAGLAFLHFALRPVFDSWYVSPNLVVCAVLIAARALKPGPAATVGFVLGVLEDSMAVSYFGLATLLLVLLAYLGSQTRDVFLAEERTFIGTYLLVGTWLYETAGYLIVGGGGNPFSYVFLRVPLDGILTGVVGYLVMPLTRVK
jgi:rod shape-determining protein MreD